MKFKGVFMLLAMSMFLITSLSLGQTSTVNPTSYLEFSENLLLSTNDDAYNYHVEPTMALGTDGVIYVGWKDAPSHNGGGFRVSYTYFDGQIWANPVMMDQIDTDTRQSDPWMVSLNGHLYYSYLEFSNTLTQLTLADTTDHGQTWNTRSATDSQGFADKQTMIVRENGDMFIAYNDVGIGMRLSSSFDGGQTFNDVPAIQDVVNDGTGAYILAGEAEELFVFYSNYGANNPDVSLGDIIFDKSSDSGATWGEDQDINPSYNGSVFTYHGGGVAVVSLPTAVYDENLGRIYVAWSDVSANPRQLNFNSFMKYTDDKGETWSEAMLIDDDNFLNQWHPDMVLDSMGNVQFAYYDNETEGYKLKHRQYFPSTNTFSEETEIASEITPGNFTRPGEYFGMEIDENDRIHVVWSDGRNNEMDIFYAYMDLVGDPEESDSDRGVYPIFAFMIGIVVVSKIYKSKRI